MANAVFYLMEPTSIAYTGTSATVSANGSVSFSAVTQLRLNGVFSADYDNYTVVWGGTTSLDTGISARLSVGGVDNSTASSYTRQTLNANGTSVDGGRGSYDTMSGGIASSGTRRAGSTYYLFGPYLAQPTAIRHINIYDNSNAYIGDRAFTHNQSTSYDGINLYPNVGSMTGRIAVYGMRK